MKTSYFSFSGGINTDSPALSIDAGEVINAINYEAAVSGGYRRIDGFERYDGQLSPSSLSIFDYADNTAYQDAVETLRSLIGEVPGEGNILGVWRYNNTTYAFRNKVGGASAGMYESTVVGWAEITTGVTLNPDGNYEFINKNFGGNASTLMMYGVDGVNKGFQFDGTTYTEISTGMTTDTPTHLIEYKNYLIYSFSGGSVQISPLASPTTTWTALAGAQELGIGEEITGFKDVPGDSLAVFCKDSTWIISGTPNASDFALNSYSTSSGATEGTIQRINYPIYINNSGCVEMRTTSAYGDFTMASLSQKAKKLVDSLRGNETASIVSKDKNQYRVFYSNNRGLSFTFSGDKVSGVMPINYGKPVLCCCNGTDSDGSERLFFGSDDGYVYEMDAGYSFDGGSVEAWIRPSFYHFKSPEQFKRFFKIVLEIDADQAADLTFLPVFDYSDPTQPDAIEGTLTVSGGGGFWDEDNWGEFYYDSAIVSSAYGYMDAIAKNFSMFIRSNLTYEKPHTIQGAIIHYSPKGLSR